jgi:hypothetical protein
VVARFGQRQVGLRQLHARSFELRIALLQLVGAGLHSVLEPRQGLGLKLELGLELGLPRPRRLLGGFEIADPRERLRVRGSELATARLGVYPAVVLALESALELIDRLPPGLGAALGLIAQTALLEQGDGVRHACAPGRGCGPGGGAAPSTGASGRTGEVHDVALAKVQGKCGATFQKRERRCVCGAEQATRVRR